MQRRDRRDIIAYYVFSFLVGFYLPNGTTVLFERQLGLSFSQVFTLDAVYMLMFILFEIPSGAFADLAGRKKTVVFGLCILAVAAIVTGNAGGVVQLLLSSFIWALGFSLISGSSEAMLYDRLADAKRFHVVFGRARSLSVLGMALSGVAGPLLYAASFRLPYLLGSIPFAAAAAVIMSFEETGLAPSFSWSRHWRQIREGTRMAFDNRFVLWSTGMLALVFAVGYTFASSYQPYLVEVGFDVRQFALILPFMFGIEAAGGAGSERIAGWLGERAAYWASILGLGACLLVLGLAASRRVIPVLLVYGFLQGFLRPLLSAYANRFIDSGHRATVLSVQAMFSTVTASALLFSFGFLTDRIGVVALAVVTGIMVLAVGTVLLILEPRPTSRPTRSIC